VDQAYRASREVQLKLGREAQMEHDKLIAKVKRIIEEKVGNPILKTYYISFAQKVASVRSRYGREAASRQAAGEIVKWEMRGLDRNLMIEVARALDTDPEPTLKTLVAPEGITGVDVYVDGSYVGTEPSIDFRSGDGIKITGSHDDVNKIIRLLFEAFQKIYVNGGLIASEPAIDFIAGDNVQITAEHEPENKIVRLTISATGAGGPVGAGKYPARLVAASDAPDWIKNMADYVCDGVDEQAEINSALSEANLVVLSPGTFVITNPIIMPSNRILLGVGRATTILLNGDRETDMPCITNSDPTGGNEGITIENLVIDVNAIVEQYGYWVALYLENVVSFKARNLVIKNYNYNAMYLRYCDHFLIEDCLFSASASLAETWSPHEIFLENCRFGSIRKNTFGSPDAIEVGGPLFARGCEDISFEKNHVFQSYEESIYVSGLCKDLRIVGNRFRGGRPGYSTVYLSDYLFGEVSDILIAGNRFNAEGLAEQPEYCIEIADEEVKHTMIHGNDFRAGATVSEVLDYGTDTLMRDNVALGGGWMADA